jgi:hypothetical protein
VNGLPKIEKVHVWIVVDDDGTEGIPAVNMPGLGTVPMMCGDQPGAVEAFEAMAQRAVAQIGKDVHHYVFDSRYLIKTVHPDG